MKIFFIIVIFVSCSIFVNAQEIGASPEYVKELTSGWKGERFNDGRPKVSDLTLERLEKCTLEQIWGFLMRKGYHNQVAKDWIILKP